MRAYAGGHSQPGRLGLACAKDLEMNVTQPDAVMLLVCRPGHLRDALHSLVSVVPGLDRLVTADSGLLALKALREMRPSLVLVGSGLPEGEVVELIRQIKAAWPETACLVLTDSAQGRRQALAVGADRALPAGLPTGQLFSAIQHMLEDAA